MHDESRRQETIGLQAETGFPWTACADTLAWTFAGAQFKHSSRCQTGEGQEGGEPVCRCYKGSRPVVKPQCLLADNKYQHHTLGTRSASSRSTQLG